MAFSAAGLVGIGILYTRCKAVSEDRAQVSFQWKNPVFLLKNVGLLVINVDFS